ncbi:MAG TPA: hypothetical protein VK338_01845 [Candidatus Nitrosocosmicus sp.]|nr:hypothetical protein [Candidatus Nitrosocosmicus sp.]
MKKRKLILSISFLIIAAIYVIINMAVSQMVSPLFFNLVTYNNNPEYAADLLYKIKKQPEYNSQLEYFKEQFGPEFEKELAKNSSIRRKEITRLERLLQYNQKSRDILIQLAILNYYENDNAQTKFYYNKAKEIDPGIMIKELETK